MKRGYFCSLRSCCLEVKLAVFIGPVMIAIASLLSGCAIFRGEDIAPSAHNGLSKAENNLDGLTDKRLSRVSAAITVALNQEEAKLNSVIKGELSVAKAMIGEPSKIDLDWATERASRNEASFYESQLAESQKLLAEIKLADWKYEQEKAKQEAEHKAQLKAKELELKALQASRNSDKWTWAGIGLFVLGVAMIVFSPNPKHKPLGGICLMTGIAAGSIPMILNESWFLYALGGLVLVSLVGILIHISNRARLEKDCDNGVGEDGNVK